MKLLALLLLAGCAKEVHPVAPEVTLQYTDADPQRYWSGKVEDAVLVGRTFRVRGTFEATCAKSKAPLLNDHPDKYYGTDYVGCHAEATRVDVACIGPCRVTGQDVTPTGPGEIVVTIDLTSDAHHHSETRRFIATAADSIVLTTCLEGKKVIQAPPWPRCTLDRPIVGLAAFGAGKDLGLIITARANGHEHTGTGFALSELFDTTPSGDIVDGEYDVDFDVAGFTGRARFVLVRR